ncbi:MAG: T9SS type A sorting domain-containing protein [Bacteroidales bacterium]
MSHCLSVLLTLLCCTSALALSPPPCIDAYKKRVAPAPCNCLNDTVCINVNPFSLYPYCTTQEGTFFSYDEGVDTLLSFFDPLKATAGTHEIYHIMNGTDTCFKFSITVKPLPDDAGTISGMSRACQGDLQRYSVPEIMGADSYEWTFTGGGLLNPIQKNPVIDILFEKSFGSGWLKVRGVNKCANGRFSDSTYISVYLSPAPIIKNYPDSVGPSAKICKNQRLDYSVSADFESYLWKISPAENGKIVGDSTSRMISVRWNTNSGNTNLIATVVNNGCAGSGTRMINIGEGIAPDPSTIWLFGCNILVSSDSTATCYQWLQDGQPLDGIVTPPGRYIETLTPTLISGSRYEVITCSGAPTECPCCNYSLPYYHNLKSGCNETMATMVVAPNPARDKIALIFSPTPIYSGRLLLFNQYGVLVKEDQVFSGEIQADISTLPGGLYIVEFLGETGGRFTSRIIKN